MLSLIHLLIIKHRVHKSSIYPVLQSWDPWAGHDRKTQATFHISKQVGFTMTGIFLLANKNNLECVFYNKPTWKRLTLGCCRFFRAGNCYFLLLKKENLHIFTWPCYRMFTHCFFLKSLSAVHALERGVSQSWWVKPGGGVAPDWEPHGRHTSDY